MESPRYKLQRLISDHAGRSVFEGIAIGGKTVAIKIMAGSEEDLGSRRLYQREVELLSKLNGQNNTIALLDHGFTDSPFTTTDPELENYLGYYIVLPFLSGTNLGEAIEDGKLPELPISRLEILRQIAIALRHCHQNNILHRDLKPENIFISSSEPEKFQATLIDFGIGRDAATPSSTTSQYLGKFLSAAWAAPERLTIGREDPASDIFSFALICLCTLSGKKLLWSGSHETEESIKAEFPLIKQARVDSKFSQFLARCLNFSPERRPQTMFEFCEALDECIARTAPQLVALIIRDGVLKGTAKDGAELEKLIEDDINAPNSRARLEGKDKIRVFGKNFVYVVIPNKRTPEKAFWLLAGKRRDPTQALDENSRKLKQAFEWEIYRRDHDVPDSFETQSFLNAAKHEFMIHEANIRCLKNVRDRTSAWKEIIDIDSERLRNRPEATGFPYENATVLGGNIAVFSGAQLRGTDFDRDLNLQYQDAGNPSIWHRVGKIFKFDSTQGKVSVQVYSDLPEVQIPPTGSIRLDMSSELKPLRLASHALNKLASQEVHPSLLKLIHSPSELIATPIRLSNFLEKKLSVSKQKALSSILGSQVAFAIQGPPGTGKTLLIAALCREILRAEPKSRVLISAQQNVALDNALAKIAETDPQLGVIRLGAASKIGEMTKHLMSEARTDSWIANMLQKCSETAMRLQDAVEKEGPLAKGYAAIRQLETVLRESQAWEDELSRVQSDIKALNNKSALLGKRIQDELLGVIKSLDIKDASEAQKLIAMARPDPILSEELEETIQKSKALKEYDRELSVLIKGLSESKEKLQASVSAAAGKPAEGETPPTDSAAITKTISELRKKLDKKSESQSELLALTNEWVAMLSKREPSLRSAMLSYGISVAGATCVGSANQEIEDASFDWVIVDEAAKANPGELLLPLIKGKRFVLVGDQHQLPPFIHLATREEIRKQLSKRYSPEALEKELDGSLFEQLYSDLPSSNKTMLFEQFRMCRPIGKLISDLFYGSKLDNSFAPHAETIEPLKKSIVWVDTNGLPTRQERRIFPGYKNEFEVDLCLKLLATIRNDQPSARIAVLTGYRGQESLLNDRVSLSKISAEVHTVDNYQGRQAEIVIYSCVRSNEQKSIGFLQDIRRLTVALSRAEKQLIIVGDSSTVVKARTRKKNLFAEVFTYIKSNPSTAEIIPAQQILA